MTTADMTAAEAVRRIRSGALTSRALVEACLARIGERERDVGAWACVDAAAALEAARKADASPPVGPLHGIPVGIKDIIDTADLPTSLGSPIYGRRQPSWDAACVAACRAAGAIVLGKTVTTEFAYFHPGKTRNPLDLARTPGGSSSGSAAAVADRMVPVALGTQTQGSVIRPAAFCGIVGFKPSFSDVSVSGVRAFSPSLDTVGVLCRGVEDAVLMRDVLLGGDAPVALDRTSGAPRFALCRTPQWSAADAAARGCIEAAAGRLRSAGARVDEVVLAKEFEAALEDQHVVMLFEAARNLLFETQHFRERLSERLRGALDEGWTISRPRYERGLAALAHARARFAVLAQGCDAWLVPATIGEAPFASTGGTGDPLHNRLWTAMHGPNLVLPSGLGPQGLPLGVQLVAPYGRDEPLLRAAWWAERVLHG
jgi:Asp-tRNA(Asn)/Glu-tRNA(Gln) amidotransferase A subunit family amidase